MSKPWYYDRNAGRYRDHLGRFLSLANTNALRIAQINHQKELAGKITDRLLNNEISLSEWMESFAQNIKTATIQSYTLGKGGEARLNQTDYGIIGNHLRSVYGYFRMFGVDISQGRLSKEQIIARSNLYFNQLHSVEIKGQDRAHIQDGFQFEENIPNGENCPGCLRATSLGVVPIGTLTPIGSRDCQSNDRCTKRYYRERPSASFLQSRDGWTSGFNPKIVRLTKN